MSNLVPSDRCSRNGWKGTVRNFSKTSSGRIVSRRAAEEFWFKLSSYYTSVHTLRQLITWQSAVDLDGPLVDAADEALGLRKTLLTQPRRDAKAAAAVMAMDHDAALLVRSKLFQSRLDLAHGDEKRAGDSDKIVFVLFATIEKHARIARVPQRLEGLTLDFKRG
jgi:hypothetical protein